MAKAPRTNAPVEPVNSEQAEAMELTESPIPMGTTAGELEERAAEAENRAEAAERKAETLAAEMAELRAQVALLMRQGPAPQARPDAAGAGPFQDPQTAPLFDEEMPYGIVVGDTTVAYVQDGHQFGRDRRYIATERHRGAARPFNPRLVGMTKPRKNQTLADTLDGIRDRND